MNMMRKPVSIAILLAVLASGNPALAVDIENTDERDYEVTIITNDGQGNTTFVLSAGSTEESVCVACKIKIEGVGEVDAQEGDNFEVSGGKLTDKSD